MKRQAYNDRANNLMRGMGGEGEIHKITTIFDDCGMFSEFESDEMIREFKVRKTRDWLRTIKTDIPLGNGDVVKVRGCLNITKYHQGKVVHRYVLLDLLTRDELATIIREYETRSEILAAIAGKMTSVLQMKIEFPE